MNIGVDVGNYDTKSQNTVIPSGYDGPYTAKPPIAQNYLMYDGKYYLPRSTRFAYQKDKTTSDRALLLTLMSIANEIIFTASKVDKDSKPKRPEEIQSAISTVKTVSLAVGLPPSHYTKTRVMNLIGYYEKYMKNGIEFIYNDYKFNFYMDKCNVLPQGGAGAMLVNKITKYPSYYIIDIGGYTVDTIFYVDYTTAEKWSSKEKGILTLIEEIIDRVTMEHDVTLDARLIEAVLKGENTIIPDAAKKTIYEMTKSYCDSIINILKESGIEFKAYPCLFMGGGSMLLKEFILNNPLINKDGIHFVNDNKANAIGYYKSLKRK